METLPRKEFSRRVAEHGKSLGVSEEIYTEEASHLQGIHLRDTGDILVVKGTPSGIKLHEVGHKFLGHTSEYNIEGRETIGDDIHDEILAEKFVYDTKDKKYTYRLVIPAINMLVADRYNWPPETAVFWSLKILKDKLGITATKSERRELARHARGIMRRPK